MTVDEQQMTVKGTNSTDVDGTNDGTIDGPNEGFEIKTLQSQCLSMELLKLIDSGCSPRAKPDQEAQINEFASVSNFDNYKSEFQDRVSK